MSRPLARYRPSRRYMLFALLAVFGTVFSAWTGLRWPSTWIAAALFGMTSAALIALLWQPKIEIHETHLQLGRRIILWREIHRLDQTGWTAPLAVSLTLSNDRRVLLLYAGDVDSSTSLLRHLRRYSRNALLDGIPYRQAWGEVGKKFEREKTSEPRKTPESGPQRQQPAVHRPLLRPEEEEEIERMFQRLKSVGRMDQRDRGSDESVNPLQRPFRIFALVLIAIVVLGLIFHNAILARLGTYLIKAESPQKADIDWCWLATAKETEF